MWPMYDWPSNSEAASKLSHHFAESARDELFCTYMSKLCKRIQQLTWHLWKRLNGRWLSLAASSSLFFKTYKYAPITKINHAMGILAFSNNSINSKNAAALNFLSKYPQQVGKACGDILVASSQVGSRVNHHWLGPNSPHF
jgi:hypothetical protein